MVDKVWVKGGGGVIVLGRSPSRLCGKHICIQRIWGLISVNAVAPVARQT